MQGRQLLTSIAGIGVSVSILITADQAVATYRAANLCEELHAGMDERQVDSVLRGLPGRAGVARLRGDPAGMLSATTREGARRDVFMQFGVVFSGIFMATRQCVVSVKAGSVESTRVMESNAYIASTPVQTVRVRP